MNIEYYAGLLEGEASFEKAGPAVRGFGILIRCSMTDKDIIDRLLELGGRVNKNPRPTVTGKDVWTWTAQGEDAYRIMGILLPHMGRRRTEKIKQLMSGRVEYEKTMQQRARFGYTHKY
jgi:hypothetical protein